MEQLVLWLIILTEIGFAVFSFVKQREKLQWLRNRCCVSAGELVLYLLLLPFPGIDFTFRYKIFFYLLIVRVFLSTLCYVLKKKKAIGVKHGFGIVISGLLGIVILSLSLIPSFIFADYQGLSTTGSHEVAMTNAILVDSSRIETFETDGSCREVPLYFYYPADADGSETYPLIVFSHGAFGYYMSNTSTYMELASHGYVVVSLDHPYHSFFTKDTAGKTITVSPEFINNVFYINEETTPEQEIYELSSEWIDLRIADLGFVLDSIESSQNVSALSDAWFLGNTEESTIQCVLNSIDCDRIGLMGHSLGGGASVTLGRVRDDIDAVIDLDGTMLGEETGYDTATNSYTFVNGAYPVPLLSIDNEEHHTSGEIVGSYYVNNVVIDNAIDGHNTYFIGSGHMNFTDLPLFSPFLASKLGTGTIDEVHAVETMNAIVLNFMDYYLLGEGSLNIQESYE